MFVFFAWNVTNNHQNNRVYNKILPWQNQNANQVLKHIHGGFNRLFTGQLSFLYFKIQEHYLKKKNQTNQNQKNKQTSIEFKQPIELSVFY